MMKFQTLYEAKQAYKTALNDSAITLEQLMELRDLIKDMESQCRSFSKLIHSI